ADAVGIGDRAPTRGTDLADYRFGRPDVGALAFGRAAEIVDDDRGAFLRGEPRDVAADAAPGASHQHDLAFETAHGSFSPVLLNRVSLSAPASPPGSPPACSRALPEWPKACARTAAPAPAAARRRARGRFRGRSCADACSPRAGRAPAQSTRRCLRGSR